METIQKHNIHVIRFLLIFHKAYRAKREHKQPFENTVCVCVLLAVVEIEVMPAKGFAFSLNAKWDPINKFILPNWLLVYAHASDGIYVPIRIYN